MDNITDRIELAIDNDYTLYSIVKDNIQTIIKDRCDYEIIPCIMDFLKELVYETLDIKIEYGQPLLNEIRYYCINMADYRKLAKKYYNEFNVISE